MTASAQYLSNLAKKASPWVLDEGPFRHVVISSRIRLARNLNGHLFCQRAKSDELDQISQEITKAAHAVPAFQNAFNIKMEGASLIERTLLLERHLISQEHAKGGRSRSVIISEDETAGIMVNEEDHLRLQTIQSGFTLQEAWNRINDIDNSLDDLLTYAFMPDFGFLTSCLTNTGTGLRASVMMHLPGLVITGGITYIIQKIRQAGLTVRGIYGEHSEAVGDLYQISNQITLGQTEEKLVATVDSYVRQIMGRELNARKQLYTDSRIKAEDVVYRAYGLLSQARMINSNEAMFFLSHLRLGAYYGWFGFTPSKIDELMMLIQPAHLQKSVGQDLDEVQRDTLRADFIRKTLGCN
jgi:protein arginine kinase